tara:strand:- start:4461 stop:4790 length:330 start_codon:yes stop_codon:yes gene_type:complete
MIKPEVSQRYLALAILIPAQLCIILGVFLLIGVILTMIGGLLYLIHMGIIFDSETDFTLRVIIGFFMFHVDNLLLHELIDTVREVWKNPKEAYVNFFDSLLFEGLENIL